MPAPVVSRRSLTIAAVIVAIVAILCLSGRARRGFEPSPPSTTRIYVDLEARPEGPTAALFGFRGQCLGLGHPAIGSRRKPDFFADPVGGVVIEFGPLPIMEDAGVLELLFYCAGTAGALSWIV